MNYDDQRKYDLQSKRKTKSIQSEDLNVQRTSIVLCHAIL